MSDLRTAAQQALEALKGMAENAEDECGEEHCPDCKAWRPVWAAIISLEAELAKQDQEKFCDNNCTWLDHHPNCVIVEQEQKA
jgi:hypothetical protein